MSVQQQMVIISSAIIKPFHGDVKQAQELPEGCLVHDVDHGHLHDEEVEDGAPGGHGAVLLPGSVDLHLSLCCHHQLLVHLKRCVLGCPQNFDQTLVVDQ